MVCTLISPACPTDSGDVQESHEAKQDVEKMLHAKRMSQIEANANSKGFDFVVSRDLMGQGICLWGRGGAGWGGVGAADWGQSGDRTIGRPC